MVSPLIRFIDKVCVQTAVYWPVSEPDGFGGFVYEEPREIDCRWDEVSKLIRDDKGQEIVVRAEVLVNEDLDEGGLLFLGTLSELDSSQSPEGIDAYPIIKMSKTPLFRSTTEFVRVAYV